MGFKTKCNNIRNPKILFDEISLEVEDFCCL